MRIMMLPAMLALMLLVMGANANAQCSMHSGAGNDPSKPSAKSGDEKNTDVVEKIKNLSNDSQEILTDFVKLHEHFYKIMQTDDIDKQKKELQKHNEMMAKLHEKMVACQAKSQEVVYLVEKQDKPSAENTGGHQH